eukprot:584596-Rhodomonas_salina.2
MVLAELGGRITNALRTMTSNTVIDEETVDNMLKEIAAVGLSAVFRTHVRSSNKEAPTPDKLLLTFWLQALLASDVNVKLVSKLRKNVKGRINLEDLATGLNRRRMIQQVSCVTPPSFSPALSFPLFCPPATMPSTCAVSNTHVMLRSRRCSRSCARCSTPATLPTSPRRESPT